MKMKAPEGTTSVGWRGQVFTPDEQGFVVVPEAAVLELYSHGLRLLTPEERMAEPIVKPEPPQTVEVVKRGPGRPPKPKA